MHKEPYVKLKEILESVIQNGYSPLPVSEETGRWVLGLGALTPSGMDLSQKKAVALEDSKFPYKLLQKGDFLVSRSNTREKVGQASLYKGGLSNCIYPDLMMKFRINKSLASIDYIDHYLRSSFAQNHLAFKAAGSNRSMVKITKSILEELPIYLPPLDEQKSIAAILSTWDEVIEKTERLIELKEEYFQWLTTQIFLKNPEIINWNYSTLNNLVKVKKGEQLNRTELDKEGIYPAWNGGITPSGYTDVWNTEENTVTISEGGNSCGFINYSKKKFWCGGHCYSLINVSNKICPEFLYFNLKTQEKRIKRLRVGSGLPNIQKGDIEKFEIAYPNLEEQNIISHKLNTILNEITLIRQLFNLYRQQKQALMQKLLTGKWRVKFNEEK